MADEGLRTGDDAALAGLIRSFTEAEVALREITGAAAEFRSASDSLEASGTRMDAAQASMTEVAAELRSLSATLAETSRSLGIAADALARLQVEQVWAVLQAIREDEETTLSALRAGLSQQAAAQDKAQGSLVHLEDALFEQAARTAVNERRLTRLMYLSGASLVGTVIVIALVALVALTGS